MRKRIGNRPLPYEGWREIGVVVCGEKVAWSLHRKDKSPNSGAWTNYKLCSSRRIPGRANFWLSEAPGRPIRSCRDAMHLQLDKPDLWSAVMQLMSSQSDDAVAVVKADIPENLGRGGRPSKYPWDRCSAVGDSFLSNERMSTTKESVKKRNQRYKDSGVKFSAGEDSDGKVRVWRVA